MKKMKKGDDRNYLEFVPVRSEALAWTTDEKGIITLDVENTGFFNRLFQKLLKKPKFSHVHLDELGSFVWPLLDGQRNVYELGELVKEHFGEKAEPLYPRLAKYFKILESYHFIEMKKS